MAIGRLRELAGRIEAAPAKGSLGHEEAEPLYFALNRTLRDALGENHPDIHRITEVGFDGIIDIDSGEPTLARARASRLKQAVALLGEVVVDLERKLADAKPSAPTVVGPSALQQVERLISCFHRVASRLRARHDKRATLDVKDEYDVQDLLHALLTQYFKDRRILIEVEFEPPGKVYLRRGRFLRNGVEVLVRPDVVLVGDKSAATGSNVFWDCPPVIVIGEKPPEMSAVMWMKEVGRYRGDRAEAERWWSEVSDVGV